MMKLTFGWTNHEIKLTSNGSTNYGKINYGKTNYEDKLTLVKLNHG
jgi:hypothetical protein